MSVDQILAFLDQQAILISIYFAAIPLISLLLRVLHGKEGGGRSPWKYVYSVIIYLACVPGIVALVLTLYSVLFVRRNLLSMNIVFYFLPLVSMLLTLAIIRKSVMFDEIPGFKKLYGLFALILLSSLTVFILDRLRIFLFFRGSMVVFLAGWVLVFLLFKYSTRLVFGRFKKKE